MPSLVIDRSNERAIQQITQAMLQKLETPDDVTLNPNLNAGLVTLQRGPFA